MVTKLDSIKVTLWSPIEDEANEILKCIKKTVLCNYIYQDLTVDTSYFYKSIFSDLAIESITCQIDQHIGKQIHILMYEEITYESEETILLRLKRLFYFASLCINPDICIIICGLRKAMLWGVWETAAPEEDATYVYVIYGYEHICMCNI